MAKQKIAVISVCSILLLAMVVALTFTSNTSEDSENSGDSTDSKSAGGTSTSTKAITDICRPTDFKQTCEDSLTSEAGNTTDTKELIKAAFKVAEKEIRNAMVKSPTIQGAATDPSTADAFKICQEVLSDAVDDLYRSFEKFDISDIEKWDDYAFDLKIWLSGTVAMQETCLDGFDDKESENGKKMTELLQTSRELTVNALAIIDDLSKAYDSLTKGSKRKLLAAETQPELSYQSPLCNMFTMFCSNNPEDPFSTKRRLLSDGTPPQECADGRRELHSKKKPEYGNPYDGMFTFFSHKKSSNGVHDTLYRGRSLLAAEAPAGLPATPVGGSAAPAGAPATPAGGSAAPAGAPATPAAGAATPAGAPATPAAGAATPAGAPATPAAGAATPAGAPATPAAGAATPAGAPAGGTATPAGAPATPAGASPPSTGTPASPAGAPAGAHPVKAAPPAPPPDLSQPNAVVAQDGSGNYATIDEALKAIPAGNTKRYVIHIKAGVYREYVQITNKMVNVVLVGDGPTQTKITGNRSVILDGLKTYHTATVGVDGFGFIARDIGIENTAGHAGEQAVALRVSSDQAAYYNCQIDGYQDTLYAHVHRQFYRDCTISGTIDFIFGDAAAIFQNCTIVVRKPGENQACMVTAQGRKFDYEATGFVLQNCNITAEPDYLAAAASIKSYLGRPWKDYAKTFVLHSNIDSIIQPTGWEPWPPNLYIDTCWYSEFENTGPSAALTNRVHWQGIKTVTKEEAEGFVPGKFLRGDEWIPATGVPYTSGIMPHAAA